MRVLAVLGYISLGFNLILLLYYQPRCWPRCCCAVLCGALLCSAAAAAAAPESLLLQAGRQHRMPMLQAIPYEQSKGRVQ